MSRLSFLGASSHHLRPLQGAAQILIPADHRCLVSVAHPRPDVDRRLLLASIDLAEILIRIDQGAHRCRGLHDDIELAPGLLPLVPGLHREDGPVDVRALRGMLGRGGEGAQAIAAIAAMTIGVEVVAMEEGVGAEEWSYDKYHNWTLSQWSFGDRENWDWRFVQYTNGVGIQTILSKYVVPTCCIRLLHLGRLENLQVFQLRPFGQHRVRQLLIIDV